MKNNYLYLEGPASFLKVVSQCMVSPVICRWHKWVIQDPDGSRSTWIQTDLALLEDPYLEPGSESCIKNNLQKKEDKFPPWLFKAPSVPYQQVPTHYPVRVQDI